MELVMKLLLLWFAVSLAVGLLWAIVGSIKLVRRIDNATERERYLIEGSGEQ